MDVIGRRVGLPNTAQVWGHARTEDEICIGTLLLPNEHHEGESSFSVTKEDFLGHWFRACPFAKIERGEDDSEETKKLNEKKEHKNELLRKAFKYLEIRL